MHVKAIDTGNYVPTNKADWTNTTSGFNDISATILDVGGQSVQKEDDVVKSGIITGLHGCRVKLLMDTQVLVLYRWQMFASTTRFQTRTSVNFHGKLLKVVLWKVRTNIAIHSSVR